MIYDRRYVRLNGRTHALVWWLKLNPGAVCLVPNEARKTLLIEKHGVKPEQIVVAGGFDMPRVENANVWEYEIDGDGFDLKGRTSD